MNKLSNFVFDTIKERRTIRKYKLEIPPRDVIKRIAEVPYFILQDFPIPFELVILEYEAREKAVKIMRQTYSIAKDLAILHNMVPDELKDWYREYMKNFINTLGGAPILFIGLTDIDNIYNWNVSWLIAQAIMIQAKAEGLDTGSITFSSKSVEKELVEGYLKMDNNKWKIAFVLNCGYRDEEPMEKQIKGGIYEIY